MKRKRTTLLRLFYTTTET